MSTIVEVDHWSTGTALARERVIAKERIVPSMPAKNVVYKS